MESFEAPANVFTDQWLNMTAWSLVSEKYFEAINKRTLFKTM